MKIGELIKSEIKKSCFTQKEVANKIHISESSLSQIVKGVYKPTQKHIDGICDVLGIEISYVVTKRNRNL